MGGALPRLQLTPSCGGGPDTAKGSLVATSNDLKNGLVLQLDNGLWQVVEFQHVKPGKGPAFVRT